MPGMPIFDQETFGPVAAVTRAEREDLAISLCNFTNLVWELLYLPKIWKKLSI
jgi:acyl-CoA reductase-like NAD-dependent aldehyde dehydrogenase